MAFRPVTNNTMAHCILAHCSQNGFAGHYAVSSSVGHTPGTVDRVLVEANMKTSDPNANLVAQIDWWLNSTAPFVDGFANNPSEPVMTNSG
jgi:hypothetical protein